MAEEERTSEAGAMEEHTGSRLEILLAVVAWEAHSKIGCAVEADQLHHDPDSRASSAVSAYNKIQFFYPISFLVIVILF